MFAFLLGAVANEGFKVAWEKIFPPKDRTPEVLAVNHQIMEQVGELRAVLLQRLDSLPTRAEDRAFLANVVNTLAQNAGALGQLNSQLARGEDIGSFPNVAPVPSPYAVEPETFATALLPDTFVTGGVGGGERQSPEMQVAETRPNVWIRSGEVRVFGENPDVRMSVLDFDPLSRTVRVALNEQRWLMTVGSYATVHGGGYSDCRVWYVRAPGGNPDRTGPPFHGFETNCGGSAPTSSETPL